MKKIILLFFLSTSLFAQFNKYVSPNGALINSLESNKNGIIAASFGKIYYSNNIDNDWITVANERAGEIDGFKYPYIIEDVALLDDDFGQGMFQINNLDEIYFSNDLGASWLILDIGLSDLLDLHTSFDGRVFIEIRNSTIDQKILYEIVRTSQFEFTAEEIFSIDLFQDFRKVLVDENNIYVLTNSALFEIDEEGNQRSLRSPDNDISNMIHVDGEIYLAYSSNLEISLSKAAFNENQFLLLASVAGNYQNFSLLHYQGEILFSNNSTINSYNLESSELGVKNLTLPFNMAKMLNTNEDVLFAISPSGIAISEDGGLWWEEYLNGMNSVLSLLPNRTNKIISTSGLSGELRINVIGSDEWNTANFNSGILLPSFPYQIASSTNGNLVTIGAGGIAVSQDNGQNWSLADISGSAGDFIYYPCYNLQPNGNLVMYFGQYIFVSSDEGLTWRRTINSNVNIYDLSNGFYDDDLLLSSQLGLYRTAFTDSPPELIAFENQNVFRSEIIDSVLYAITTSVADMMKVNRVDLRDNSNRSVDLEIDFDLDDILTSVAIAKNGTVLIVDRNTLTCKMLTPDSENFENVNISDDYLFSLNRTGDGDVLAGGIYGDIYEFDNITSIFNRIDLESVNFVLNSSTNTIQINEGSINTISISDLNGNLLIETKDKNIPIDQLFSGPYFIRLTTSDSKVKISKFIKN